VEGQCLLGMLRRLWQGLEQLDPGSQVADGFQIGREVAGLLAGPLPVGNGLLRAPGRGIVLGHQLGLGLYKRGELRFEDPGNLLVHLLPGALEQRRIGRIPD
jgi:hypothetical protein